MSMPLFVWNDAVHEAREGARLQFWRFSFVPDYDRDAIFQALHRVFRDPSIQIRSFIIYEAFGDFDLLLRAWVPRATTPEDLGIAFERVLDPLSMYQQEYTLARATLLHWVWQDVEAEDATARRPNADDLLEVSNSRVSELTAYNDLVLKADGEHVPDLQAPQWVTSLRQKNLLSELSLDRHGMRFYVRFDHSKRPLRRPEQDTIARRIRDMCVQVARQTRSRLDLSTQVDLSLYVGSGPMTDFLILARAPDGHFYSFARDLIFGLHRLDLHTTYSMRTYTEVLANRNFAEFQESPTTEELTTNDSVLDEPESESLEFKASFAFDVHRFLATGQEAVSKVVTDSAVKAICGLLNAPLGGRLIIGALEIERELERAADRSEAFNKLSARYPIRPQATSIDLLRLDSKAILGIEADFAEWDKFVLRLEQALRNQITPYPRGFIEIQKLQVLGKTLAVVLLALQRLGSMLRPKILQNSSCGN